MCKNSKTIKYIVLVFCLSLVMLLCSCGESKENDQGENKVIVNPEVVPEIATIPEATEIEATKLEADVATGDAEEKNEEDISNGKVIVLDPGHSNIVTGDTEPLGPGSSEMKAADASGTRGTTTGLTEIELNFQIAIKLQAELEKRGYTVILTRSDNDTAISCSERAKIANDAGADAFIRIHADGSESSSASGAMGICITSSNPYISSMYSESRRLSDAILNAYVAETGFSSRGVWETDTMTGNNWATVPTTLLEMGFMTNPNEDTLMADPTFQEKMVTGIANGVDTYCFTD